MTFNITIHHGYDALYPYEVIAEWSDNSGSVGFHCEVFQEDPGIDDVWMKEHIDTCPFIPYTFEEIQSITLSGR